MKKEKRRLAVFTVIVLLMVFAHASFAFELGIRCFSDTYGHLYVSLPDCEPLCNKPARVKIYAESPDGNVKAYYDPLDPPNDWKLEEKSFDITTMVVPEIDIAGHLMIPAHHLSRWKAFLEVEVDGEKYKKGCHWCGATREYCALVNNIVGYIVPENEFEGICIERGCGLLDGRCVHCARFTDANSCSRVEGCFWNGNICMPHCGLR